ncbi:hypothetical protein BJV78DRAFT_1235879 [Lactifluus subvellereus]|nr:hypothetical protein BJV78DRAFT_1235879 [Lactifluus subvellereus]
MGMARPRASLLISMLISNPKSSIFISIPQYLLYTAMLAAHGVAIPYHLDEEAEWVTSGPDIESAIEKAVGKASSPRCW